MKNLKMYLGFIALLFISLSSCDDGNTLEYTIVKGQILEYGTEMPIEGAKVLLYEEEASWGGGLSYARDTAITGADGSYEFRFSENSGYAYTVRAFKDQYYDNEFLDILPFRENNVDLVLDPYAWLELHIKNVNPYDENDLLTAYTHYLTGASPENHHGQNIDFFVTQEIKGNREIPLIWWVTKNGVYTEHKDTIYCGGHDLTKYELFY